MTHPSEVDAVTHEFTQIASRALIAARQVMAHRQQQTQMAHRAAHNAAVAAQQAELARHWRAEALAARWAATEAMREHDPRTADAWSQRLEESGVDTDSIRRDAARQDGPERGEPETPDAATVAASTLVAEHLAAEYVNEGLDAPPEVTAPSPPEAADITALIADTTVGEAEKSSQPDLTPDQPAASVDTGPGRDTGVTL